MKLDDLIKLLECLREKYGDFQVCYRGIGNDGGNVEDEITGVQLFPEDLRISLL